MFSTHLLNQLITLERPLITIDASAGSKREVWEPVPDAINIYASIQPVSSKVRQEFASRQIVITHRIYLRTDLKSKRGDRIKIVGSETYYLITGFFNQAGKNSVYMIEGKEVVP